MFDGFANVWTPVAISRNVRKRPVSVELAGEKVVLFRGAKGEIGALIDRCPHRGVALSTGRVTPEGCIQCPYHRYEFATDGECKKITLHPEAKRELMGATALPVRDRGGLIWVYTAPGREAPREPIVPPGLDDASLTHYYLEQVWTAHWARVLENMLDTPHLPYVHRRSIGMPLKKREKPDSRMKITLVDTPDGCQSTYEFDGFTAAEDPLEFTKPNRMSNRSFTPEGKVFREFNIWGVPLSSTRTRLIVGTSRSFGRHNPLFKIFDQLNRLILYEDRSIVESQTPVELPRPGEERSVAGDAHTLRFRKYYFDELHSSSAEAPRARPALVVNE